MTTDGAVERMVQKRNLKKPALVGAGMGAAVALLNVYSQSELAGAGPAAIALTVAGGALGGAVLLVFIALVAGLLSR